MVEDVKLVRLDPHGDFEATPEEDMPEFPEIQAYPSDLDWRDLSPELTSRCLTFPTEVEHATFKVAQAIAFDAVAWLREMHFQLPRRGIRAGALAYDLRRAYGLPMLSAADQAAEHP